MKTPGDVVIVSLKLKTDDVQFDGVLVAGVSLFHQTGVCFSRQIDRYIDEGVYFSRRCVCCTTTQLYPSAAKTGLGSPADCAGSG